MRIIVGGVIIQIKTGRQGIITRDRVEVIHSSEDKMSGNDNNYWIQI